MATATSDAIRRQLHRLAARQQDSQATDRELLERFSRQRDESAFANLVRRHGALVLATAGRVLGNRHDAEDVGQAAFILLAQKAASQRWDASVASWLYTTTHHLALKARTSAARLARRERRSGMSSSASPLTEITGQELLAALDEELLALPESLRAPLVLCYLQGSTRDEAAQRLGCPLATLKKRLERGRGQLHAALVRRGLGLSALLFAAVVTQRTACAATSVGLARKVTLAAAAVAAGRSLDGILSSEAANLVKGGLRSMNSTRLKATVALLLVGGLLSTVAALAGDERRGAAPQEDAPAAQEKKVEPGLVPGRSKGLLLRYKFKEGDTFSYVTEKKTETLMGVPGHQVQLLITHTYDVTWKVKAVDSDGNAQVTLTIDRFRYVHDETLPVGRALEFDSAKQRNPQGLPGPVRALSPILRAHVGAQFTCTVSPRGEVSDFKVPKKLADTVKNSQGSQAMYSADTFKQQLACQGGVVLHREPVVKDTGWNERADQIVAGGREKLTVDTRAIFMGEAERGGQKVADITLKPTASTLQAVLKTGLGPFTLKTYEGKGSMLFDHEKGRLVETEVVEDMELESSPPGQVEKIVWKAKITSTTKLVPSK
jgi:RNA polymerase sigma factor (sigma-70 family)